LNLRVHELDRAEEVVEPLADLLAAFFVSEQNR
jgi:hypothetical protein